MKAGEGESKRPSKQALVIAAGVGAVAAGASIYEVVHHRHLAARNRIFDAINDKTADHHIETVTVLSALLTQRCCTFADLQHAMFGPEQDFADAYRATNQLINSLTQRQLGKYALVDEVGARKCDNEFCDLTNAHYKVTDMALKVYQAGLFGPDLVPSRE